jgi:predicted transcriptional regulator
MPRKPAEPGRAEVVRADGTVLKRITISLKPDVHKRLAHLAVDLELDVATVAVTAIEDFLERRPK